MHPQTLEMLKEYNLTTNDLKNLHLENNEPLNMENLAIIFGNENFVRGIHKVAQYQAENSKAPTYLYKFTFKEGKSVIEILMNKKYEGNVW